MTRRLATLVLVTALLACAKKGAEPSPTEKTAGEEVVKSTQPADVRKVIHTGRVDLVVAKYDEARAKLDALVGGAGGYVDATQVVHRQGTVSEARIVVRVPSQQFAATVARLRELGEVQAETTDAADVTEQYTDVASRMAAARVLEKRLLELVAEKGGSVDNVLAVERELARVRTELEGYQGRMRVWDDQIAMSTLTLTIRSREPELVATESRGLGERISSGFRESVDALGAVCAAFVVATIALAPWLAILGPVALIVVRLRRRRGLPTAIASVGTGEPRSS